MDVIQKPTIDLSLINLNTKNATYPKIDKCDSFSPTNSNKFYSDIDARVGKKRRVEGEKK